MVKFNDKIDLFLDIVMNQFNIFRDELQSDVVLAIMCCARILAGVKTDPDSYR